MRIFAAPSHAKLNLFLEVAGKRTDGFHDLESVFLEIDLADRLEASPAPPGVVTLACDRPALSAGEDNLIVRAARLLAAERGVSEGIHFRLEKRIPLGGGLGGGSSNAAAALKLASRLWNLSLDGDELRRLGGRLGSDVPFFFHGGTCLITGRGEIVQTLSDFPEDIELGVVLSDIHSDTAAAFRRLSPPTPGQRVEAKGFIQAMATREAGKMAAAAFNRFEETVFRAIPELGAVRDRLAAAGLPVRLSGSGSALWFFGKVEEAEKRLADDPAWPILAGKHGVRLVQTGPIAQKSRS